MPMNEHGSVEISVCEHLSDVAEVTSNLIAAVRILNVVGANVDRPAVVTQFEMMGGLLVRKSHHMVAMHVHGGLMILPENTKTAGRKKIETSRNMVRLIS